MSLVQQAFLVIQWTAICAGVRTDIATAPPIASEPCRAAATVSAPSSRPTPPTIATRGVGQLLMAGMLDRDGNDPADISDRRTALGSVWQARIASLHGSRHYNWTLKRGALRLRVVLFYH
jgi:hypothetical protein